MARSAASLNKHKEKKKTFAYRSNTCIYFAHPTEEFDLF